MCIVSTYIDVFEFMIIISFCHISRQRILNYSVTLFSVHMANIHAVLHQNTSQCDNLSILPVYTRIVVIILYGALVVVGEQNYLPVQSKT